MENIRILLAILTIVIGTVFSLTGVIGYIRFPDVYTRLHATAKVSVFGGVLLLVAAVLYTPLNFGKGLALICLLLVSGPVVSHSLASAAYRIKILPTRSKRNDLTENTG